MVKHTPGPWVAKREGNGMTVGTWVQQVGYEGFGTVTARVPSNSPVAEADATLLAASPDLLDACRRALGYFDREHGNCAGCNTCNSVKGPLAKAIAKAEGRAAPRSVSVDTRTRFRVMCRDERYPSDEPKACGKPVLSEEAAQKKASEANAREGQVRQGFTYYVERVLA